MGILIRQGIDGACVKRWIRTMVELAVELGDLSANWEGALKLIRCRVEP